MKTQLISFLLLATILLLLALAVASNFVSASNDQEHPFEVRKEQQDDDDDEDYDGFDPSLLHPGAKITKTCPEPGSPSVGDMVQLHIPSIDHLIPRFHGMRVFAPTDVEKYEREKGHIKKESHDLFNEHHQAKVLYAFDAHAVQAIWPAHSYEHGGKNLKVKLTDLFVVEDFPHRAHGAQDTSNGPITMCFFKASFF